MTEPYEPVYWAYGALEAETIRLFLESHGIPAQTSQEALGTVYGLTVGSLGKVRILVPEDRAEEAIDLLRRMEAGEFAQADEEGSEGEEDDSDMPDDDL